MVAEGQGDGAAVAGDAAASSALLDSTGARSFDVCVCACVTNIGIVYT